MNKLRVLWFSPNPAAGDEYSGSNGTGGWMKTLDKAIQNEIELHVAFYNRRYPTTFVVGNTTYHSLAPVGMMNLIKRRISLFFGKKFDLKKWQELINEVNPDIIHVHGTELGYEEVVQVTNKPVVLSIQAILTSMTHKYYGDFNKTDLGCFYWFSKYFKDYKRYCKYAEIERDCLTKFKYVIGRTEWDRRVYSILAPNARYYTNNEILRDGFYHNRWKDSPNGKRWIIHTTTGSLLFKGLETICMALEFMNRSGMKIEWHIAGISENDEIVKITKRKLGIYYPNEGLKYLGKLSEKQLIETMLDAHLFVYPTHQDNSSNALCEAMLLGMPCLSTFAGGSGTILTDKQNGVMVQDGEPWAMAGAIKEMLNNRELALEYANKAYETAHKRHSKDCISIDLLNIYKEVASIDN